MKPQKPIDDTVSITDFHTYLEQKYSILMSLCYDCTIDKGWWQIVLDMAKKLDDLRQEDASIRIVQIKEKFGLLRVYLDSEEKYDDAYAIVQDAEKLSAKTCEFCGSKENVYTDPTHYVWIKTYCAKCHDSRKTWKNNCE